MKSNGLFKRILLMLLLSLIGVGIVVLGVVLYYRQRTIEAKEVALAWEKCERELYTFSDRDLSEEQIEDMVDELCDFYTEEFASENYHRLYDAVSEISVEAHTVDCYQRIITDIRVDNQYRQTRVFLDCVIDYEGYGPYLINGEDDHLVKRQKCTYTIKLEREGESFVISEIYREWDTNKNNA